MTTTIYGCSDDLIEFEGDFNGETGAYATEKDEKGILIFISDGTLLEVKYGKNDKAVWEIKVIEKGSLFQEIKLCTNESDEFYSDRVIMNDGIKWAYAAKEWESVR